ncbi:MAG: hypothetical protein ACQETQ_09255 [Spirochaetota bacterium]
MSMSARRVFLVTLTIAFLLPVSLGAQDAEDMESLDEALRELSDKVMRVDITARVTSGGEETVWDMELTRVTISGRAVTLRLDGSNITVVSKFTPYYDSDDSVLLVAQGQTWITQEGDSSEVDYQTSFKSMPVELGESVVFLPLGNDELKMDVEREDTGTFNIELEVTVVPYEGDSSDNSESDSKSSSNSE